MAAETVSALAEEAAARHGAAPAMLYRGAALSYAALLERSQRVAGGLAAAGIGPGDRVALWLPNTPAYVILYLALARLGAVAVAVNTRFRAMEVQDIVGRGKAKALAMWPGFKDIDFVGILGEIDPKALSTLELVIHYGEDGSPPPEQVLGRPVIDYAALETGPAITEDRATPETPVNIFTTSGTTKAPKFVVHRHAAITRHARDASSALGYDQPGARIMQAVPLCGVFGFCNTMSGIAAGAPLVVIPLFDSAEVAAAIRTHDVTHMMGTDDMFTGILRARAEPKPFPSLRLCGFGIFNPAIDRFLDECEERGLKMAGLYGMSECQALYSLQDPTASREIRAEGGGMPVSSEAKVRVRDTESGALLEPGVSGEIELCGPSLMIEYADNPEANAEARTADGWLRTGDAGRMRADGSFVFEARMGDTLRLGGFLTSPAEIEAWIEAHPSVAGVQVVGVLTDKGLKPFAFIIPQPGQRVDAAALDTHCRGGMANYKVPIRFEPIDEFPVTVSANAVKIQRNKLRQMAEAIAGRGKDVAA